MEELRESMLKRYPTWQAFVKEQEPKQLIVNYDNIHRIADVFESTEITLLFLSETYPLKNNLSGIDYLIRWLSFLNDFLNINKGIPVQFIGQLAYSLYAKYNHFKLSDLKLLFDFILESRYGTFYGSIDSQRIVSSFFEYNRERCDVFTRIRAKIQEQEEKELYGSKTYTPPDFSKFPNLMETWGMRSAETDVKSIGVSISEKLKQ